MPRGKVNKSEKVRQYLKDNPEASAREVVDALSRYKISPTLVYNIKSGKNGNSGPKGRKARRGRKPGAARGASTAGNSAIVLAAKLVKACGSVAEAKKALDTVDSVQDALN